MAYWYTWLGGICRILRAVRFDLSSVAGQLCNITQFFTRPPVCDYYKSLFEQGPFELSQTTSRSISIETFAQSMSDSQSSWLISFRKVDPLLFPPQPSWIPWGKVEVMIWLVASFLAPLGALIGLAF